MLHIADINHDDDVDIVHITVRDENALQAAVITVDVTKFREEHVFIEVARVPGDSLPVSFRA